MSNYPLRVLIGGIIVSIVGIILLILKPGFFLDYIVLAIGIIALVIGIIWNLTKNKGNPKSKNEEIISD